MVKMFNYLNFGIVSSFDIRVSNLQNIWLKIRNYQPQRIL